MPGAIIAIDQDQGSPSFGSPGVARNDLWLNRLTTIRSTASGNISYLWSLLDVPPGSAATLASATSQNATFTPDLVGSYRLQLITNGGGPGNVQILVAAVTKDHSGVVLDRGWRIPALGENVGENNFGGQLRGWDEAIRFILADLEVNFGKYVEIPFLAGNGSTSVATPGAAVGGRQLNVALLPPGTKTFYLVATLVSTVGAGPISHVEFWNITRGYMVTGGALDNSTATDPTLSQTFVSAALPVGTSANQIRTDSNDEYEVRLYRAGGTTSNIVSCTNCHLRVVYSS